MEQTRHADALGAGIAQFTRELRQFRDYITAHSRRLPIGFDRMLRTHEQAPRLGSGATDAKGFQAARDNLEFDSTLWGVVKRCRGLVALKQHYRADWDYVLDQRIKRGSGKGAGAPKVSTRQDKVVVDAVVNSGATWIRLLSDSDRRLLFELADIGVWGSESDTGSTQDAAGHTSLDYDGISIVRKAKAVVAAAKNQRHEYRHPSVHFVLPKINEAQVTEIGSVVAAIRGLADAQVDVTVDCADSAFLQPVPEPRPLADVFSDLAVDELADVSHTVNLDVSWLIALASDLSHQRSSCRPLARGMKLGGDAEAEAAVLEECGRALWRTVYPTLAGRRLVCASSAADTVWSIAETLATDSELARLRLLLPRGPQTSEPGRRLRRGLEALSSHAVPAQLQLPVTVAADGFTRDVDGLVASGRLPRVATAVSARLREPNRSIFLFGWATGHTTLTANSGVANSVRRLLECNRIDDDEVGPHVKVRWVTRSFDAKEKPAAAE